jgi:hypothetical protein
MTNQTNRPDPSDVADDRGRIAPAELPGEAAMAPDAGVDASAGHEAGGDPPPTRRIGTQGAAIEDLADPDADANFPEPSKPVATSAGTPTDRGRGRDILGGGYGDSRDVGDCGAAAINDEEAGAPAGADDEIHSGSHVTEDDTKGRPPGSNPSAEHPSISQPTNVTQPRRP